MPGTITSPRAPLHMAEHSPSVTLGLTADTSARPVAAFRRVGPCELATMSSRRLRP